MLFRQQPHGFSRNMPRALRTGLLLFSCRFLIFGQSLYTVQTKDLNLVYYDKGHEYLVYHTARCFENAWHFHCSLFSYSPSEPVTVLLNDFGDYGNGAAGVIPHDLVSVTIAPFSYTYETLPANERMNWVMNHELTHIVSLDKPGGSDGFFRSLFSGKVAPIADNPLSLAYSYLTTPRTYSSRWFREGLAVFMETWMAGGLGRALGSYDEMKFRTLVHDSSYFYDPIGLESQGVKVAFDAGTNYYLYGTRFITYLADMYGTEPVVRWIVRSPGSDGHYVADFSRVFGSPLETEWNRWIAFEKSWQKSNLDSVRSHPVTECRRLSQIPLGSVSRAFYDSSRRVLYACVNYPGQVAYIAAVHIDDGRVEHLVDIKGGAVFDVASLQFDERGRRLFFTTDNNDWRDINILNLDTGDAGTVQVDARVGDFAFNKQDSSLWGIRHSGGISTIVRIPPPYREWNQIYSWPYGKDMYDIDISPDGTMLSGALADVSGRQRLILIPVDTLMKGDCPYEVLYDFENSNPANFIFSPDNRYLTGTSYYTGVSNIFRYDLREKKVEVFSNVETGLFRPVNFSPDSLIAFQYTSAGFVPVILALQPVTDISPIRFLGNEVVDKNPVVKSWKVASPASVNIDSLITFKGEYDPFDNIAVSSFYPVVEGYKDFAAFGMRLNLADAILLDNIDATASYTPNSILPADERFHGTVDYRFWGWKLKATYNSADFYDLFGPTKMSRKGYSGSVQYKKTVLYNLPESMDYTLSVAGYGGLDRLPDYQNVAATFDKLLTASARLHYEFLTKSIGATDNEKGVGWDIALHDNEVSAGNFPFVQGTFDVGFALPINHSALWFRTAAGQAFGDRNNPFGNFYFGGFGNNWVDHLDAKRFRQDESFPGTALNSIGGSDYAKFLVEWMTPPARFTGLGGTVVYCNWIQPSLFSSVLATNINDSNLRQSPYDAGSQVDFHLVFFSTLEATLSFGYAVAFDRGNRLSDEWMASLKIL